VTTLKDTPPPNHKRVLLAVTAHPDDETFGMGGTLAFYARQGVEVHLICATRGELGEAREEYMKGYNSVAEMRMAELHCAAKILGITGVHQLNYRDSGMANSPENNHPRALAAQPVEKVADEIIQYIRLLKPQVVITFDPIGGYHHPDHIAIHRATVNAFYAAGDIQRGLSSPALPGYQPARLFFHTMPHGFIRMAVKILPLFGRDPRKFGSNHDIDLTVIASSSFPTHVAINTRHYTRIQDEASACHASQGGREMTHGLQAWLSRLFRRNDTFMRDYPAPVRGEPVANDLFEGIHTV
jgi:N-acetyl-1-D-myo-inositol-2-amino-2-deoxy-alpha-D-glucopyranoside deacetylase